MSQMGRLFAAASGALALAQPALAAAPVIVITGQAQPKPLATLPGNTAVLGTRDIDRIKANHPAEALNRLPGVLIHRGSGAEHLSAIRSPVLTGGAGQGSFLYLEDGIPLRAAGFANVNELFDAHSELAKTIEVVRGPGGALYGSNAEHGLVNFIGRGPGDESFTEASAGSFGRSSLRSFAGIGVAGSGASLALTLNHEDGYRAASGLDQQKATLRGEWRGSDVVQRLTLTGINLNQETAGFVVGPSAYKSTVLARANLNPEAFRDSKDIRASYRLDRARTNGEDTLVVYARANDMAFLQHFFPSKALEKNWDWGAGWQARRTIERGKNLIAFGLDGEFTDGALQEIQSVPTIGTFVQGVHYDYVVLAQVLAPYLHTEWQLGPRTRLTAGARYEITRYDYRNHTPANTVGRFQRPASRIDTYGAFTPNLALSYDLAPGWFAYGRLARGARAPQTSDAYRLQSLQVPGAIKVETLDSAEAGLRGLWRNLSFQLAAYTMEKRNFFFRDADGFNVTNGRTRHRGVEFDFVAPLFGTWTLAGAAAYARHSYAFTRPVSSSATESIRSGDDVDTAPRVLANASLLWSPSTRFEAELAWEHVGRYFTDAANLHSYRGHHVFDLRAGWHMAPSIEIKAAVRNLGNTNYAERADFAFGEERYFPGETRAFELALRVLL